MRRLASSAAALALVVVVWLLIVAVPTAQNRRTTPVAPTTGATLGQWDGRIDQMLRTGDLQIVTTTGDTMLPWHSHQRMRQMYRGVPVFGGDLLRDLDNANVVSVFGQIYSGIDLDVAPRLNAFDAKSIVEGLSGEEIGPSRMPALVILPKADGSYVLAYDTQVATSNDITRYFIDANTGEVAFHYSNLQTQTAAVNKGTGTLGDLKKISVTFQDGIFYASDRLRPPQIITYDMKGAYRRTKDIVNGLATLAQSDQATSTSNVWTDAAVIDAHAYAGLVYDFYFKKMNRRGLNDRDLALKLLVNPIPRDQYGALLTGWSDYYVNAFWDGEEMVFGVGLPPNVSYGYPGAYQRYAAFSAGLDVVAHELTHGVTQYSAGGGLIYNGESGALNEAFSDVMGTAVEFFVEPRATDVVSGGGTLKADYLLGEDVATGVGSALGGFRSMAKPARYGDPDHYSLRYTGIQDNGGVHINSAIANQAYYLAVEGGTNDTSRQSVTGVGNANRDQIEKIFYRAFAYKLTQNATFSNARLATLLAARELYGTSTTPGTPYKAIKDAWDAVGVDVGVVPPPVTGAPRAAVRSALAGSRIRIP